MHDTNPHVLNPLLRATDVIEENEENSHLKEERIRSRSLLPKPFIALDGVMDGLLGHALFHAATCASPTIPSFEDVYPALQGSDMQAQQVSFHHIQA